MGQDYTDLLLTRLGEDDLNLGIVLYVVVAFVDVDVAGETLVLRDAGALCGGLIDEAEKEASEKLRALIFEQAFLGVDEDHLAGSVDLGEEIDLRARARKHPEECLVSKHRQKAGVHLLAGLFE